MKKLIRVLGIGVALLIVVVCGGFFIRVVVDIRQARAVPDQVIADGVYKDGKKIGSQEWVEENARRGMYTEEELLLEQMLYWDRSGISVPFSSHDNRPIIVIKEMMPGTCPYAEFEVVYALVAGNTLYHFWGSEIKTPMQPLDKINISSAEDGQVQVDTICQRCGESIFTAPVKIDTKEHFNVSAIKHFQTRSVSSLAEIPEGEYTVTMLFLDKNTSAIYILDLSGKLQELQEQAAAESDYFQKMGQAMLKDLELYFQLKNGDTFLPRVNTYAFEGGYNHPRFFSVPVKTEFFNEDRTL